MVLDEFPYLAAAYPPITTILQRYWDQYFKKSQIMLILCGSYLDTLQQLHLIEQIIPVTENKPQKSRMGLYRLKDDYLRFWFRFSSP